MSAVMVSKLQRPGYKKWVYETDGSNLTDLKIATEEVPFERAGLVLSRPHISHVRGTLNASSFEDWADYGQGWMLALKILSSSGMAVRFRQTDQPVYNYNQPADLKQVPVWVTPTKTAASSA